MYTRKKISCQVKKADANRTDADENGHKSCRYR